MYENVGPEIVHRQVDKILFDMCAMLDSWFPNMCVDGDVGPEDLDKSR